MKNTVIRTDAKETPQKVRCNDCCYLIEDDNGGWICDDCGKEIHNIPDDECSANQYCQKKVDRQMEVTRIKVYHNGTFIVDFLCPRKKTEAIKLLRKGYPEFKDCVIVTEDFDISKPENQNYLDAMLKCEMVL